MGWGPAWAVGTDLGGRRRRIKGGLSHLRASATWGTAALRSHRSPPSSLLPALATALPSSRREPRHVRPTSNSAASGIPRTFPPGWGITSEGLFPHPHPGRGCWGGAGCPAPRTRVAPATPCFPWLGAAGTREQRAKGSGGSEGGAGGTALPLPPSLPGSIYTAGFGGLFAENTFSL